MAAKVKALQQWCKRQCEGYRDVNITNMTSSWKSGLAFCAIIHRYRPDIIDYDSLSKENVFENNKLAFDVAQNELGIPALLDPEDMVAMTVPDKLCIVTYVSQYHNYFRKYEPAGGPGVKATRTAAKRQLPSLTPSDLPDTKKQAKDSTQGGASAEGGAKRGTLGDTCSVCGKKVYIMERHIEGSKLYHRKCLREIQRTSWSPTPRNSSEWPFDEKPPWCKPEPPKTDNATDSTDGAVKSAEPPGAKSMGLVKSLFGGPAAYKSPETSNGHSAGVTVYSKSEPLQPVILAKHMPNLETRSQPMEVDMAAPPRPMHLPVVEHRSTDTTVRTRPTRRDMPPRSQESSKIASSNSYKPNVASQRGQKKDETVVFNGLMQSLANIRQQQCPNAESTAFERAVPAPVAQPRASRVGLKLSPTEMQKNAGSHNLPKPILKPVSHSPGEAPVSRNRSSSPPKSILKHSDHTSPGEVVSSVTSSFSRSTSPPKSILKHTEFSPDTKQEDAPPKSILKRGSFDSDGDDLEDSMLMYKPKKSILKSRSDSGGSDPDSGPNSRVTSPSRSILKNSSSTDWIGSPDNDDAPKRILKLSPLDHKESPRSILKKSQEWTPDSIQDTPSVTSPSHTRILKPTSPSREPAQKQEKPKSILKVTPRSDHEDTDVSKPVKSAWTPAMVKAKKSPGSPSVSASFSERKLSHPDLRNGEQHPASQIPKAHSDYSLNSKKPANQQGRTSQEASSNSKPDWQIEAERRKKARGGKYEDPEKKHLQPKNDVKSNGKLGSASTGVRPKSLAKTDNTVRKAEPSSHGHAPSHGHTPSLSHTSGSGLQNGGARPKRHAPPPPSKEASQLEWQKEAERRAHRNENFQDPEKVPFRGKVPAEAVERPKPDQFEAPPVNVPCYLGMNMSDVMLRQKDRNKGRGPPTAHPYHVPYENAHHNLPAPHPLRPKSPPPPTPADRKSKVQRCPAFRIPDDSSPEAENNRTVSPPSVGSTSPVPSRYDDINNNSQQPTISGSPDGAETRKRKILPEVEFSFASRDFGILDQLDGISRTSPVPPPEAPPRRNSGKRSTPGWMNNRRLPSPPDGNMDVPKRRVNAEARMATLQIVQTLESLDEQLRGLEEHGRDLELKIRSRTDEAMDEDDLMVQWFELVNQKNELVRKESELMYRQRQQELEDLHEELEYELRCLMDKPESQKTGSDKIREEALLQELLDTVSQRNNIVDSIEEDRLRYMEEDQEIAEMLALTAQKKKKKNKKKGNKRKGERENRVKQETAQNNSSPDYEIDEIDCEKEREKERNRKKSEGRKLFGITIGTSES